MLNTNTFYILCHWLERFWILLVFIEIIHHSWTVHTYTTIYQFFILLILSFLHRSELIQNRLFILLISPLPFTITIFLLKILNRSINHSLLLEVKTNSFTTQGIKETRSNLTFTFSGIGNCVRLLERVSGTKLFVINEFSGTHHRMWCTGDWSHRERWLIGTLAKKS